MTEPKQPPPKTARGKVDNRVSFPSFVPLCHAIASIHTVSTCHFVDSAALLNFQRRAYLRPLSNCINLDVSRLLYQTASPMLEKRQSYLMSRVKLDVSMLHVPVLTRIAIQSTPFKCSWGSGSEELFLSHVQLCGEL